MTRDDDPDRALLLARRLFWLGKRLGQAQRRWGLIEDGDRILLGLSGGKDSLTLLYLLCAWRRRAPVAFALEALHVEPEEAPSTPALREELVRRTAALGVPLAFVRAAPAAAPVAGRALHPCFLCARRRRELLLRHAGERGCGKIALAHHLDDDAETVLLNLLFRGDLSGLAPRRAYFGGAATVIRPLILAEERQIADVAALLDIPAASCACPAGDASQRRRMKALLASFGREATAIKRRLQRLATGRGERG